MKILSFEKLSVRLMHQIDDIPLFCIVSSVATAIFKMIFIGSGFQPQHIFHSYVLDRSASQLALGLIGIPCCKIKIGIRESVSLAFEAMRVNNKSDWLSIKKKIRHEYFDRFKTEITADKKLLEHTIYVEPVVTLQVSGVLTADLKKQLLKSNGRILWYLDEQAKKNRDLVKTAIMQHGAAILDADPAFLNDLELVLLASKTFQGLYRLLPLNVKRNTEVIKACCFAYPSTYLDIDQDLKTRDLKRKLLETNGLILQHMFIDDKNDEALAKIAIMQNGLSLEFVSRRLKTKYNMAFLACQNQPLAFQHADQDLKKLYGLYLVIHQRAKRTNDPYLEKLRQVFQFSLYNN